MLTNTLTDSELELKREKIFLSIAQSHVEKGIAPASLSTMLDAVIKPRIPVLKEKIRNEKINKRRNR